MNIRKTVPPAVYEFLKEFQLNYLTNIDMFSKLEKKKLMYVSFFKSTSCKIYIKLRLCFNRFGNVMFINSNILHNKEKTNF